MVVRELEQDVRQNVQVASDRYDAFVLLEELLVSDARDQKRETGTLEERARKIEFRRRT